MKCEKYISKVRRDLVFPHVMLLFSLQPTIIDDIAAFKSSLPLFPLVPPYHSQPTKSKL